MCLSEVSRLKFSLNNGTMLVISFYSVLFNWTGCVQWHFLNYNCGLNVYIFSTVLDQEINSQIWKSRRNHGTDSSQAWVGTAEVQLTRDWLPPLPSSLIGQRIVFSFFLYFRRDPRIIYSKLNIRHFKQYMRWFDRLAKF